MPRIFLLCTFDNRAKSDIFTLIILGLFIFDCQLIEMIWKRSRHLSESSFGDALLLRSTQSVLGDLRHRPKTQDCNRTVFTRKTKRAQSANFGDPAHDRLQYSV